MAPTQPLFIQLRVQAQAWRSFIFLHLCFLGKTSKIMPINHRLKSLESSVPIERIHPIVLIIGNRADSLVPSYCYTKFDRTVSTHTVRPNTSCLHTVVSFCLPLFRLAPQRMTQVKKMAPKIRFASFYSRSRQKGFLSQKCDRLHWTVSLPLLSHSSHPT
ncbi:hypothetical protein BGZ63DRAFT_371031, partial [Mariannaea sp. PMI_226]